MKSEKKKKLPMKQRLKAEFQILLYGIKSLALRVRLREISLSKQSKEKKENNCEIMKSCLLIIHRRKRKQKRKIDRHFLKRLD